MNVSGLSIYLYFLNKIFYSKACNLGKYNNYESKTFRIKVLPPEPLPSLYGFPFPNQTWAP